MAHDPVLHAHKQWLGYLQPVGLVVAPHALVAAQAVLPEHVAPQQQVLHALTRLPADSPRPFGPIRDHRALFTDLLGWRPSDLVDSPDTLAHPLPEYGETLRPTYAVQDPGAPPERPWLLLIEILLPGTGLDTPAPASSHNWDAPPQAKFERLLRESGVPIGLLCNGELIRLVYAPRGETSGHLSFPVAAMCEVSGRPILAALQMLLGADRLFSESDNRRLPALLSESRKYQNEVSVRLAEQVLGALLELLRGFQAADEATRGSLLRDLSREDPQHIYGGLLTVLLRLVFLLYAEDRSLMPAAPPWADHYSVTGLYLRLREDAGRYPDTMDQRYGAWASLLSLFRLVYTGGTHDRLHLPAREGRLFDPDSYPFLEGRIRGERWQPGERREAPRVPDGVLWRVLQGLLLLDGERLSYRALDVEDIGSVYEAMMGFKLERATGPSIAVRPQHVVVDLGQLLGHKAEARAKALKEQASCDLTGAALAALKAAKTPEDVVAALGRKQSPRTPAIVPAGSLYLQPGEERRKSGSHYTPRSLTGPIVRTTLRPVLEALGEHPTAEQILELKLCDPAMGSGAFLVEAARQLGEHLRGAWDFYKNAPQIPPDEDPDLHARRLVAQRCLYGVDKNPFAVDLAKLSLWLVTLAKDHPFTFLDHALKHGDSLVGLNKGQIAEFRWDNETRHHGPLFEHMRQQVGKATALRREIHNLGDEQDAAKRITLKSADDAIHEARLIGDAVVSTYFSERTDTKFRRQRREAVYRDVIEPFRKGTPQALNHLQQIYETLRTGDQALFPFHWEIEFPEVFDRMPPGFDSVIGNPPFLGGTVIGTRLGLAFHDWVVEMTDRATGNVDLVGFFFRRAFALIRNGGTLGLVATNSLAQGDTRIGGLEAIANDNGEIYDATRRQQWPGDAAVVISIVHISKGDISGPARLDGRVVERISPFLLPGDSKSSPSRLMANVGVSYVGREVRGSGFLFEDNPTNGSTSLEQMAALLKADPRCADVIFPYMGGEEFNSSPTQSSRRYVIDFGLRNETEAKNWPSLLSIVEERVKPIRIVNKQRNYREEWWRHATLVPEATEYLAKNGRILALTQVSKHLAAAFVRPGTVLAKTLVLLLLHEYSSFAVIQSQVHESWVRFSGSTMKDDLRYTPTDCFENFPLPGTASPPERREQTGKRYHDFRADLMVRNNEGLTKTYNRFHDPDEHTPEILKLRELHGEMDRAVLTAYGWADLAERATCDFRLDYEDDEETDPDEAPRARAKKKPWRYRWPQEFHDEVLARLLDLNQQRAAEERIAGATNTAKKSPKPAKKTGKAKATTKGTSAKQTKLLDSEDD